MTSRGILPDHIPAGLTPRWPIIEPTHPILQAITEFADKQQSEYDRTEQAQVLQLILAKDIEAEKHRALGSESTQRIYLAEFKKFRQWCMAERRDWLPTTPQTLAEYVVDRAADGASPSALDRAVSAIIWSHEIGDKDYAVDNCVVRAALRFARRNWEADDRDNPDPMPEQPDGANTPTPELTHHGA